MIAIIDILDNFCKAFTLTNLFDKVWITLDDFYKFGQTVQTIPCELPVLNFQAKFKYIYRLFHFNFSLEKFTVESVISCEPADYF